MKTLQNSWEKFKKSNCLVAAELQKINKCHILTIFPVLGKLTHILPLKKPGLQHLSRLSKKSNIRILRELNIPILLHRVQTRRVQWSHLERWVTELRSSLNSIEKWLSGLQFAAIGHLPTLHPPAKVWFGIFTISILTHFGWGKDWK